MAAKHLIAGFLLTLGLAGPVQAQTDAPFWSEDKTTTAPPRHPSSHPASASRRHAAPKATPAAADARDPLSTIVGDMTGVLDTVFGVRNGEPDDPSALPRE